MAAISVILKDDKARGKITSVTLARLSAAIKEVRVSLDGDTDIWDGIGLVESFGIEQSVDGVEWVNLVSASPSKEGKYSRDKDGNPPSCGAKLSVSDDGGKTYRSAFDTILIRGFINLSAPTRIGLNLEAL